jgi:hypothetical protein
MECSREWVKRFCVNMGALLSGVFPSVPEKGRNFVERCERRGTSTNLAPDQNAIARFQIVLVSRLDIERLVSAVQVAH